jgi:uncharacterized membrane protein
MKAVLIALFIYSAVLTLASVYKSFSSYFEMDYIDAVVDGPVMWVLLLVVTVVRLCMPKGKAARKRAEKREQRKQAYRAKSDRYVQKTVKRIVKHAKKRETRCNYEDFYDLNVSRCGQFVGDGIEGWSSLEVSEPANEWINKRFDALMLYEHDRTAGELKKLMVRVDETYMRAHDNCEDYIKENKDRELYSLHP